MRITLLAIAATVLGVAARPGFGLSANEIAQFDLLPGWRTESGTHMAAMRVRLAPGWKTYWRAPGDTGIPPQFDWANSRNIESVDFHWPIPETYDVNGFRTIGYAGELVLPIEIAPLDKTGPISVRANVQAGVCREVCVPMSASISAELPVHGVRDKKILAAINRRPLSELEAGVGEASCGVETTRDGLRLTATIDMPRLGPDETAIFELPDPAVWVAGSTTSRIGGQLVSASDLYPPVGAPFMLDRSDVRITVLGGGQAVDIQGC